MASVELLTIWGAFLCILVLGTIWQYFGKKILLLPSFHSCNKFHIWVFLGNLRKRSVWIADIHNSIKKNFNFDRQTKIREVTQSLSGTVILLISVGFAVFSKNSDPFRLNPKRFSLNVTLLSHQGKRQSWHEIHLHVGKVLHFS